MISIYLFAGLSFALILAAIWKGSRTEDRSYTRLLGKVQDLEARIDCLSRKVVLFTSDEFIKLNTKVDIHTDAVTDMATEIEALQVHCAKLRRSQMYLQNATRKIEIIFPKVEEILPAVIAKPSPAVKAMLKKTAKQLSRFNN